MTTWYVAPDNTTVPGVGFPAIGSAGYGTSFALAVKWSEFNQTSGLWKTLVATGDTIIFLQGRYLLSALIGGWTTLSWGSGQVPAMTAQTITGGRGYAQFVGTRTSPWPLTALAGFVTCKVAAGSNGAALPQANINVDTTTGFKPSGSITISGSVITYTGITGTSFTGCTGGSATLATNQTVANTNSTYAGETFLIVKVGGSFGTRSWLAFKNCNYSNTTTGQPSTTIAAGSNGAALPQAVISVASTVGFPSSGTLVMNALGSNITYTGIIGNTFTGCTGGSGTMATGQTVTPPIAVLGTDTALNCKTVNVAGGLLTTQSKSDGRIALVQRNCALVGLSIGNGRVWGGTVDASDHYTDSELQWSTTNPNSAAQTYGFNSKDSLPSVMTTTNPVTMYRCVGANFRGGTSGGSYDQGDWLVLEEAVGAFSVRYVMTRGCGDRGVDAKSAGTVVAHISYGDGYAAAHHMDTFPMNLILCNYQNAPRLGVTSTPSGGFQASGWMQATQCMFKALPTAADIANNPSVVSVGNVDPSKFQSSIYGSSHRGILFMTDCIERVRTSVGAAETSGYTATAESARTAAIFGLTPGSSNTFKVRAIDPTGVAGPFSPTVTVQMDAPSLGDVTGPTAPTGLTATPVAGGTKVSFDWVNPAQDAGVNLQGIILRIKMPGDVAPIITFPGKTHGPVVLSGFLPATAYSVDAVAYDANGNLSAVAAPVVPVAFTTSAGSTSASTPAAPLTCDIASGWLQHPTMAGISWPLPASGVVAYYEICNGSGTVLARSMPIAGVDNVATLTKKNVQLVTS